MRTESFREDHPVELTEDDRNTRGRQAARLAIGLTKHDERVETEAEAWRTRKKTLAGERETLVGTLHNVSSAAETGKEVRPVLCREELVGVMVITVRTDTAETVDSRPATKDELREHEKPPAVPGGGAKVTASKANGYSPDKLAGKLSDGIFRIAGKIARTKVSLGRLLAKAVPEATPLQVGAAIESAILAKHLGEESEGSDKLIWAPEPKAASAVDDDEIPFGHDDAPATH